MKNKKIIIVQERALFQKNYVDQLELSFFSSVGYEVELWSLAPWKMDITTYKLEDKIDEYKIYNIDSQETFDNILTHANNIAFIIINPYHSYDAISGYIRGAIYKKGLTYCNLSDESNPTRFNESMIIPSNQTLFKFWLFYKIIIRNIYNSLGLLTLFLINIFKHDKNVTDKYNCIKASVIAPMKYPAKINFYCQKLCYAYSPLTFDSLWKKNHMIPSVSYFFYKREEKKNRLIDDTYIVFIDQALTQDTQRVGKNAPITDVEKYYYTLNKFFERIESLYHCNIIIAGHPKGEYNADDFGGRRIIKYQTINLIKNSEFAITMFSTSLSYIIMADKPFLQISVSDIMQEDFLQGYYDVLEKYYGIKTLNIFRKFTFDDIKGYLNKLSHAVRNKFIKKYINDSEIKYQGMSFAEIILLEMISTTN